MFCYFFIDTSTTLIYTLSLHDALPIYLGQSRYRFADLVEHPAGRTALPQERPVVLDDRFQGFRSEEHTSELQSRGHLVFRLLLEKKNRFWLAALRASPEQTWPTLSKRP